MLGSTPHDSIKDFDIDRIHFLEHRRLTKPSRTPVPAANDHAERGGPLQLPLSWALVEATCQGSLLRRQNWAGTTVNTAFLLMLFSPR